MEMNAGRVAFAIFQGGGSIPKKPKETFSVVIFHPLLIREWNATGKGTLAEQELHQLWECYRSARVFGVFLAHLMGELIVYQSLRRPSVRPSTFSNIFSSETIGPIKLKFHMETP